MIFFILLSFLLLQDYSIRGIYSYSYKITVLEKLTHQNQLSIIGKQFLKIFEDTYAVMVNQKTLFDHRYAKKIKFNQDQLLINFEDQTHVKEFLTIFQKKSKEEGLLVDCISYQNHQFPESYELAQNYWHHTVITTGLCLDTTVEQTSKTYPYLPHQFCLWQLAKKKGKGVTIAFIDTGFALSDSTFLIDNYALSDNYNPEKNYNLIKDNPFEKLMAFIKTLLKKNKCLDFFDPYQLEVFCIEAIYSYLEHKTIDALIAYFDKKNCKIDLQMQEELKQQLEKFNIITIAEGLKNQKKFLLELLPITIINNLKKSMACQHGSYVASIAAAIAPEASFIMIKAFDHNGKALSSSIIQALIATLEHMPLIVNISYKVSDFIDLASSYAVTLQTLIDLIPYCVASSGNDGHHGFYGQGYPAQFESVAFDIGAFAYDHSKNTYPIPSFSQYELKDNYCVGPKFLAPGYNITSSSLYGLKGCSALETITQSGTSMAAPIISSFIALMLAEFPDNQDFTREQLLKVCYTSGFFLDDNYDWKHKSIFGALDFRTVLFTLHILRSFKKESTQTQKLFMEQFDQLVGLIHSLLKKLTVELIKKNASKDIDLILKDPDQAIKFVTDCLLFITNQSTNKPVQLSSSFIKCMKESMEKKNKINLFNEYPLNVQKKIKNVFSYNKYSKENHKIIKNYLGNYEFSKFLHNAQWYEHYWNQQSKNT